MSPVIQEITDELEILCHNFTLCVSTDAFESRILSSIYELLTLGPSILRILQIDDYIVINY